MTKHTALGLLWFCVSFGMALKDSRLLENGRLMATTGYMDQPYVSVIDPVANRSALSRWVVTVTENPGHEGMDGERTTVYITEDQGETWKGPIDVNPELAAKGIDNSYSAIIAGESDRLWIVGVPI